MKENGIFYKQVAPDGAKKMTTDDHLYNQAAPYRANETGSLDALHPLLRRTNASYFLLNG